VFRLLIYVLSALNEHKNTLCMVISNPKFNTILNGITNVIWYYRFFSCSFSTIFIDQYYLLCTLLLD